MGTLTKEKPHLVVVPFPAQGHVTPVLTLAKLLHSRGFYITFVHTEYNHRRLVSAGGPDAVKGLDDFRFEAIPDGLPTGDCDRTQDIPTLCQSIANNVGANFLALLKRLNACAGVPPVTCVVSDGVMSVTLDAAEEMGIPEYVFYTPSACGALCYLHYSELIQRGYVPLKDESCLTNGYLETELEWMAGMKNMRLKDLPSFIRTTDINDTMLNYDLLNSKNAPRAKGVILNTFDELEHDALEAMKSKFSLRLFTIGPLNLIRHQIMDAPSNSIGANLWKEETECLDWLDQRDPESVVYVNFGSITVMGPEQLIEFAWGLANSGHYFLWVVRPDLVKGGSAISSEEFKTAVGGRGMLATWCPQEQVLAHTAVGCFLTHSGWNSTVESISSGVPMICWPFFSEQLTNCRFSCCSWGVGVEIEGSAGRRKVEEVVREVMGGEKGKTLRKKAMEWKVKAESAVKDGGSSHANLERLVSELLACKTADQIKGNGQPVFDADKEMQQAL